MRASGAEGVHHCPAGHASERRAHVLDPALGCVGLKGDRTAGRWCAYVGGECGKA